MVASILILFYFSLKLIVAENINNTNFSFQLQNTEDEKRQKECFSLIISLFPPEHIPKEKMSEIILCISELLKNPTYTKILLDSIKQNIRLLIGIIKPNISEYLTTILIENNMPFLCDLVKDVFGPESKFYDDLIDVIEKHTEFIDYSFALVKEILERKIMPLDEFLKYMYNITNIDGMDKVSNHILNSTHNGALLILAEKLLNGTKYAEIYESLKDDIIYPYKNQIIRLVYNILKSGLLISEDESKDKEKIVYVLELIKKFMNSIKPSIRNSLKKYLTQTNMTFLYNLTAEIFSDNSTFIDDLFDVLENHTEIINYTLILLNNTEGKEITQDDLVKYMYKILNIDGMDKVFGHIVNSTYNGALLILYEKLINGTKYDELYESLKSDIIYPKKDEIIRLIYIILKSGLLIPKENSKNKEKIINALELVKEFMNSIKPNMRNYLEKYLNQNNMTFLCNFIADVLSENSTFIDEIFEVLENHTEIINYTLILLNGEKGKKFSEDDLFKYLSSILKIKGMDKVFNKLYQKYRDYLFDIIKIFPQEKNGKKTLAHVFIILKDFIKKYQDVLIELLFKLISHNGNNVLSAFDLKDFLFDNRTNTSFLRDIRVILTNKTLVREIRDLINFNNNITNTILEKILFDEKLINLIIDLLHKPTFVIEFINILANLTKPDYINKHVPKFLKNIINGNFEVKNTILISFSNILREVLTKQKLKNMINVGVSGALIGLIYDDVIRYNITDSCKNLFEYTYFKPLKYVQNEFRFYFMKKFVFDSTKSKNDFLTYENCLNGVNKFKIIPYEVKPIFVVGRIIDKYNQSKLRNSSYYDKYQYMLSFCFPQGKNITNNKSLCTEEDYGKLILTFNGVSNNVYNATVTTFNITQEDLKRKASHFAYFSLIVIISALPLFISIFLKIYEKIKLSNPQKNEINNKLNLYS